MDILKKHRFLIFIALTLILIAAGITAPRFLHNNSSAQNTPNLSGFSNKIGGEFYLTNHLGQAVSHDYFQDKYKIIYFGFTYCPAICPTELQKITAILKALPPEMLDNIAPLFITIDPDRDTVDVMHDYVSFFHPNIIGLTGTTAQIAQTLDAFKIYATKVYNDDKTDYTMDHSSFIYVMGPDDRLLKIYRSQDTAQDMTKDIEKILSAI